MSAIKFIIVPVFLALYGCGYEAQQYEINEALDFCKDKGGIDSVTFYPIVVSGIQCNDGSYSGDNTSRKPKDERD